jgi:hypothetical protein
MKRPGAVSTFCLSGCRTLLQVTLSVCDLGGKGGHACPLMARRRTVQSAAEYVRLLGCSGQWPSDFECALLWLAAAVSTSSSSPLSTVVMPLELHVLAIPSVRKCSNSF